MCQNKTQCCEKKTLKRNLKRKTLEGEKNFSKKISVVHLHCGATDLFIY